MMGKLNSAFCRRNASAKAEVSNAGSVIGSRYERWSRNFAHIPARANMLIAPMSGQALAASELARLMRC
jgi:hypothetical protein